MAARNTGWAQLKIGLVAIFALSLLAVLIVLMSGTNPLFQRTSPVYVYFDDSFAMTPGATPVRLNGILIGKVKDIDLSGSTVSSRRMSWRNVIRCGRLRSGRNGSIASATARRKSARCRLALPVSL